MAMDVRMIRTVVTSTAIAAVLGLSATAVAAHPRATLRSASASVMAGSTLSVVGSEFAPGETVRLVLSGALAEFPLGEMTTDADGNFMVELTVPREVRAGEYRLVALAADDDEIATVDLAVMPAMASMHEDAASPRMSDHAIPAPPEARADEFPIERDMGGIEWGVIGLIVGLSAGLGTAMIGRSRP